MALAVRHCHLLTDAGLPALKEVIRTEYLKQRDSIVAGEINQLSLRVRYLSIIDLQALIIAMRRLRLGLTAPILASENALLSSFQGSMVTRLDALPQLITTVTHHKLLITGYRKRLICVTVTVVPNGVRKGKIERSPVGIRNSQMCRGCPAEINQVQALAAVTYKRLSRDGRMGETLQIRETFVLYLFAGRRLPCVSHLEVIPGEKVLLSTCQPAH